MMQGPVWYESMSYLFIWQNIKNRDGDDIISQLNYGNQNLVLFSGQSWRDDGMAAQMMT